MFQHLAPFMLLSILLLASHELTAFRAGRVPRNSFIPSVKTKENCRLYAKQQKSAASGDFEIGSSLITLLSLAQEISSSNNLRFRQAADRLRNQFARSFAVRYNLDRVQFLSSALASVDGDDKLSDEQIALRDEVLMQLRTIERRASSIIFFNEPLPNLDEYNYPFTFPYDALEPLRLPESKEDSAGSALSDEVHLMSLPPSCPLTLELTPTPNSRGFVPQTSCW